MFSSYDKNAADNVYLNLSIQNSSNQQTAPAVFSASYDQPILDKPSDYYAAVVKFEIPLQTLPLLVFPLSDSETKRSYLTYNIGTADSVSIPSGGSNINGTGTTFSPEMVGGTIVYASGQQLPITEYISSTQLRSNISANNPNQAYTIYNGELYETGTLTQVGTTVTLDKNINVVGFNSGMAFGTIIYSSGQVVNISTIYSPTTLTATAPLAIGPTSYKIYYDYNINISPIIVGVCENNQPGSFGGLAPYTPFPGFSQNVLYVPQNQFASPSDISYPYVYSYTTFVQYLNEALLEGWIGAGTPGGLEKQPYFHFNPATSIISLVMPEEFLTNGANGWTVFWNNDLETIIPSFPTYRSKDTSFVGGRFELNTDALLYDEFYTLVPETAPGANNAIYAIGQDYQTVDYINSVRKIVLLTRTIPVRKQYFPPPNSNNSGVSNTIPILSDFQINLDNTSGAQRQVALYEAQLYRLNDMISDTPFRRIDIELFWSDTQNNLYPIYLEQNDSATLKLGFFSKKLYKDYAQNL